MKSGEIWEYIGPPEELTIPEEFSLELDSLIRILNIWHDAELQISSDHPDFDDLKEIKFDELIEFEHLKSGVIGVLERCEFVKLYRRVYNHPKG